MVDTTSSATAAAAAGGASALSRTRLAENFDTFLTLLTTQMKNQDPLSPMDSNQFTQQLTQMTGVEQQLLTNDLLKQLVGNSASGISAAVGLIGKDVRAVSSEAALAGGKAEWTYKLDRAAADLKLEILDANGAVVANASPDGKGQGDHSFAWDGKGSAGSTLPDGTYTLRVTATDADGKTVPSTTYIQGVVTSVEQDTGQTLVNINGAKVSWDRVTNIGLPAAPSTASTGSTGNANPNTDDETSPAAAA